MHGFGLAAVLVASFTDALRTAMLVFSIDQKSKQITLYLFMFMKLLLFIMNMNIPIADVDYRTILKLMD